MSGKTEQIVELCGHMSALCNVSCTFLSTEPAVSLRQKDDAWFCNRCKNSQCVKENTLLYGCSEAYRWNGKYVFYCPQGLVFIASSLSNGQGNLCGGMLIGPFILGGLDDTLFMRPELRQVEDIDQLRTQDTVTVRHIQEVLAALTDSVSSVSHSIYGAFAYQQEQFFSDLYQKMDEWQQNPNDYEFLIKSEKQLHNLISAQDKEGAQRLLNELLGYIYFTGEADMKTIKARLIELVVILSRSAIDAGANTQEILFFNEDNIITIENLSSLEELSIWITGIMHRFIQYSFDFTKVKHADVLYKIMQYVKANCHTKITLDDIASHVYLSRSYISSLFKDEMGESLFSYINRVRVEKSKTLLINESVSLADVGDFCGFDDQSYFTKVFKNITGVSPKKYRDSRGKI